MLLLVGNKAYSQPNIERILINDTLRFVHKSKRIYDYGTEDVRFRIIMDDSLADGHWVRFDDDKDTTLFMIKNKLLQGFYISKNDKGKEEGFFKNGKKQGDFVETYSYGKNVNHYENGYLLETRNYLSNGNIFFKTVFLHQKGNTSDNVIYKSLLTKWYEYDGTIEEQGIVFRTFDDRNSGFKEGEWLYWYPNDQLKAIEFYKKDKKDGLCSYYDEKGWIYRYEDYKNGKLKSKSKILLKVRDSVECYTELMYNAKGKLIKTIKIAD
jgi:antitoxin component YwqK of YwqJK toxin-antitoxin module